MQLLRTERVRGRVDVRAHLVEQRTDRSADRLVLLRRRHGRCIGDRRMGDRWVAGKLDIRPLDARDEFRVAGPDVHGSDDEFHAVAPSLS